jgi:putative ABC transport system permease protein
MFKLNLKIAFRNLVKNKVYTLINILGLSIGMACCILIFLFIKYQLSFDEGFKNEDRIFRVVTNWKYNAYDDYSAGVPTPFMAAAREELAGVEKVAAIVKRGGIIYIKDQHSRIIIKTPETIYYAEPEFFEIFSDIKWIYGIGSKGLSEPGTVALSETIAKRYFGTTQNAVGKSITLGTKTLLKVIGVFQEMPSNSSFPLTVVVSYETFGGRDQRNWDAVNSSSSAFVLLKEGITATTIQPALAQFNKRHYTDQHIAGNQTNAFQALKEIHFSERYDNFRESTTGKREIYGLGIIGLFLMLTACINFINLSTAQSVNRSKEVGVRKVMGGKRKQLIGQFLIETFVLSFIAMLLACVMAELAIPSMQSLFKDEVLFSLFGNPSIFLFLFILVMIVSLLAGFYPAMVISGFNPALAIKNKIILNSNGLSLRKILVVAQFSVTILLIIGTLVIINQMQYLKDKSVGFQVDAVAMINLPGDSISETKYDTFKEMASRIPGVEMLSFCQTEPLSPNVNATDFAYNGIKNKDFELRTLRSDENYFKLFDLKIIAGKVYSKSDTVNGFVVNETFLKKMHIMDPSEVLGKMLDASGNVGPIVGVVRDYNDKSLREPISGLAIFPGKNQYYSIAIKADGKQLISVMKNVEQLWNKTFPTRVYSSGFLNERINTYYENERTMGTLFKVFAGVIIFISFIGLFGLISFVAKQRSREVAIRKVLGATTLELVKMLNGSFLLMVFLANVVAWPLAYVLVSNWLSGFAYRMDLSIWPFLIAMGISMFITLATVSLRSYKAAVANTVDALKYE